MAEHLDALHVTWEYEPRLFVLDSDLDGNCTAGFRPDFYLPEQRLYIEVTMTRTQTPKNKKLRLAQEQYPEEQFFLFGRADFQRPRERLLEILKQTRQWPPYDC